MLGSPKEGYLLRVGKVKPTLLTFPPISLPQVARLGSGTFKIYRGPGSAVSVFGTDTGTDKSTAVPVLSKLDA